ncbi:MAG: Pr6Pr family membrane protein [Rudaea sp.]
MNMREHSEASANTRTLLIAARLLFGLLTFAALGRQFAVAAGNGHVANYFSFFTTLSNLLAAIVLTAGAIQLLRRRQPTPADDIVRGSAVVAMTIVGLVFGLLLRRMQNAGVIPWVNFVIHYLMPVVMVADWLLQPPESKLALRHIGLWLIYPVAYLIYALVRGAVVDWYPYWFIDPHKAPGGWSGVVLYGAAIAIGFLVVSGLLLFLGNRLRRGVVY